MRYLILALAFFAPVTWADCGHGNNPCEVPGPPGPQGEQGPVGPAGPQGEQGVAGTDGQNGTDGQDGVDSTAGVTTVSETSTNFASKSYVNGNTAGLVALQQIDFSSSTRQWQIGTGVGWYDGEQAIAVGVGKLIPKYDMLFKGSATYFNSAPAYGVGLMWKLP